MRIVVDRFLCDGNGLCVLEAPRFFALDADDELHVLEESFGPEHIEQVRRAVQSCPKAALSIAESD